MDRDPAPDRRSPHEHEAPAAQPLTEIILKPAARPSRPPAPPPEPPRPAVEHHDRRRRRLGAGRLDDPRRVPRPGHRHADPLLPREPDPGQRLPGLRRRGQGLARPRPGLLAQGRGRDGRLRPTPSASAISRKMVLEFLGSSVDLRPRPAAARLHRPLRRRPRALRDRRRRPRRPASATRTSRATTTPRPAPTPSGPDRRPAGQGRQRPLRPRLLEVHPLLQVRRGLRRGRPEHVRDRGRRVAASTPASRPRRRSRCPIRPASTAATASASARPAR